MLTYAMRAAPALGAKAGGFAALGIRQLGSPHPRASLVYPASTWPEKRFQTDAIFLIRPRPYVLVSRRT